MRTLVCNTIILSVHLDQEALKAHLANLEKGASKLIRGSCLLSCPEVTSVVERSLQRNRGIEYELHAWVIMPNHVHLLLTPLPNSSLSKSLQRIKGWSSREVNLLLEREGSLWERESFTHTVRSAPSADWLIEYIHQNPVLSNLAEVADAYQASSACQLDSVDQISSIIDPKTLPFVQIESRGELPRLAKTGCTFFATFRLLDSIVIRDRR